MRTNLKSAFAYGPSILTHEGAPAKRISTEMQLRRSVLSCLLWEDNFYEDGKSIGDRIGELASQVKPEIVADLAVEARHEQHLRHVPLLLLRSLIKHGGPLVAPTIEKVVSRADELSELVALYWADKSNKKMLPKQMKVGLAHAFGKFGPHALAKYNRDAAVKLRDVLFLVHARPPARAFVGDYTEPYKGHAWKRHYRPWKELVDGTLASPDTWEVELSAGKDKRETFERLIREGKLGYLALLRNLRGMAEANVDEGLIRSTILERKGGAEKVLPFRYVAAARAAPRFEPEIDRALCVAVANSAALKGKTVVLVDVSGSMDYKLSSKSNMSRADAAAALASVINGDLRVFSFSEGIVEVPARRGMAGVDAILRSQSHASTMLGAAVHAINGVPHDRLIVVTDEQSHDRVPDSIAKWAWMINVASAKNGVGYGRWNHIDGWSEHVIRYIIASEAQA